MTLSALTLSLKKAWIWCKHHWKILLLAAWSVVVWVIARRSLSSHKKVLNSTIQSYKAEIEAIQSTHEKEIERRNKAIETYRDVIQEAEKVYSESQEELDVLKRERLKELVNQYTDDPESLNSIIESEFGFTYVK